VIRRRPVARQFSATWEDAFGVEREVRGWMIPGCPATYWDPADPPEWDEVEVQIGSEWLPVDDEHLAEVTELLDESVREDTEGY